MLVKIDSDPYFISKRIKEIYAGYFIVFNTKTKHFEVHSKGQAINTYCVGLPFPYLDERTIDFVQKTRVENVEKLIKEMDKENDRLEKQNAKKIVENAEEIIKKISFKN